jgi:small conductance mechanosensitive channel
MEETSTKIYEYLATYGLDIVAAILIFVIGRWLAKVISKLIAKAMTTAKIDPTLTNFVKNLSHIALLVFVVIATLTKLGIPMTQVTVVIGAAGLAVGFALQGSLSNFAAGIMLIIFKPFKVGDFVELAGKMGTVKEIQIFNTILNSPDNVRIIIPNGQATGTNIMNFTVNGTRRIDLVIGVSYEDDLKKTHDVIEKIVTGDDRILKEPAYTIAVSELADSSVNLVVRPWVNAADYWVVRFDLIEKIKLALDKNGITIPFPQHDVHMKNAVS